MIGRREFLAASVTLAGGIAFGYRYLRGGEHRVATLKLENDEVALTPYVIVDPEGITLITPRAEMGQGIHTTLAALVAEELDVELDDVAVAHGQPSELYSNEKLFGVAPVTGADRGFPTQLTGGQASTQDAFVKMRKAGAAARLAFVAAAARRLGVEPSSLATRNGAVIDAAGNALTYLELAPVAATIELPQDPPLRPASEWKLLGRSLGRVDMAGKCTGTAEYAPDVRLPGMLFAAVRRNPGLGGVMDSFDARKALGMRGVRQVVPFTEGVVVVATNTWYALRAAAAVDVVWGDAPYPATTAKHFAALEAAFGQEYFERPRNDGDVDMALDDASVIEGEYRTPYLAHATMEPMNATAWFHDGKLDIWAGNQNPVSAQQTGARTAGIDPDQVVVHTTYMGGGFGRRLEMDYVIAAVHAAVAMKGTPVRVMWSREEDMTHDVYRPLAIARFRAAVADGAPAALDLRLASPSMINSSYQRKGWDPSVVKDKFMFAGASEQPYRIPNYRVSTYRPPNLLPVGWWRSVGESQNSFFHESVIDELAHAAGADPLQMRLELVDDPGSRRVIEAAAEISKWGSPLPQGHARGVAFVLSSGAPTAQVVEVRELPEGIEIVGAFVVADVGIALDPVNVEAQLVGSFIYGLNAALVGEITLRDGRVEQDNFHQYKIMRMADVPPVEVRIVESGKDVFGVGEAGTAAAAPALGNAIFAATGQRLRELPFANAIRFA